MAKHPSDRSRRQSPKGDRSSSRPVGTRQSSRPGSRGKSRKQRRTAHSKQYLILGGAAFATLAIVVALVLFLGGGRAKDEQGAGDEKENGTGKGKGIADTTPANEPTTAENGMAPPLNGVSGGRRRAPKKYSVVISAPRVAFTNGGWTIDVDYEFRDGDPNPAHWYQLSAAVPAGVLRSGNPGTALKRKGTWQLTGISQFGRPVSGEILIRFLYGTRKGYASRYAAEPLKIPYTVPELKVYRSFTTAGLDAAIKAGDESLKGKLIRITGPATGLTGRILLSLQMPDQRFASCRLEEIPTRKFLIGEAIEVEGVYVLNRPGFVTLMGCRVVGGYGSLDLKTYKAGEFATGASSAASSAVYTRVRIRGEVQRAQKDGEIALKGPEGQQLSCRLSTAPEKPIAIGDQVIVEGVVSRAKSSPVILTDCRLLTEEMLKPPADDLARAALQVGIPVSLPTAAEQTPDANLVNKVRTLFRQRPKSPLPAQQKWKYPGKLMSEQLYQWNLRDTVQAYETYGRKNPKWDATVVKFLTNFARIKTRNGGALPLAELLEIAKKAIDAGCDDPLLVGCYAVAVQAKPDRAAEALKLLQQSLQSFSTTEYPARCRYPLEAALAYSFDRTGHRLQADTARRRCIRDLVSSAAAKNLTESDRRHLLHWVIFYMSNNFKEPHYRALLTQELRRKGDPWIAKLASAYAYVRFAWQARGSGSADTVTPVGWKVHGAFMNQARRWALEAWDLHPDYPEAAAHLIKHTMVIGGVAGETERFWFDQSVGAEFNQSLAYSNLREALLPRWNGSHKAMLEFGQECLDTERWLTNVPWEFHFAVEGIAAESDDKREIYRLPGIYERYHKLLTSQRDAVRSEAFNSRRTTQLACVTWLSGRHDEARKLLEGLGDKIDKSVFEHKHLPVTLAEIRGMQSAKGSK